VSSSADCSRDKPPFSFVRGQDSTMWDIVWVSPQGHESVSVSRHFLLQAPQCPCSVQKRFSRDHCCRGRSKSSCRIVRSHTRWELTTWADFQLCLHRLWKVDIATFHAQVHHRRTDTGTWHYVVSHSKTGPRRSPIKIFEQCLFWHLWNLFFSQRKVLMQNLKFGDKAFCHKFRKFRSPFHFHRKLS